ncbi:MAG: DUF2079 domain-containing protein [Anaerolineae bacterium]
MATPADLARGAGVPPRPARRRVSWLSAAVLALYLVTVSAVSLSLFGDWAYDDPFITYRYAQNLIRGDGLVYNAGEGVLSTTTPLYAMLLAAVGSVWPALPLLSNLIGSLSIAVGGWLLWRLSRAWDGVGLAMVLLLYPLTPLLYQSLGSELPFYLALCLGCWVAYSEGRLTLAALCAALALLTRGDAAILVAVLACDHWLLRRRPAPWRAVAVFAAVVGVWALFATAYYGSPIPATLASKRMQGEMAISQSFAQGLSALVGGYLRSWGYRLEASLLLVGFVAAVAARREWRLFLAWPLLYALAYTALGVPRYFWYYVPLVPATVLLLAIAMRSIFRRARQEWRMGPALMLSLVLLTVLVYSHGDHMARLAAAPASTAIVNRAAGEWLAAHTPPGASVGALEVGIVGYYGGRHMVDFAGLVQPEVASRFDAGSTYEEAAQWAVQAYRPDYVVVARNRLPGLAHEVASRCVVAARFVGSADAGLVVYRCSSG